MPTSADDPAHRRERGDPDAIIRKLAAARHGVVERNELVAAGVPVHAIDYRLRIGRLRRLHRGVYRAGPVRGRREREAAAVLACGPTAVLSHRSAATLWGLLPPGPGDDAVDVTIRRGHRVPGRPVRVHRIVGLGDDETTCHDGIRITTPPRTLLDLAGVVGERELERSMAEARRTGLGRPDEVAALLDRHRGRAGAPAMRSLLEREWGPAFTRSEAESRFLRLVRRAELPAPEVNVRIHGYEVDFLWRDERLVVEVDGFAYHASPGAFESDRRRDSVLMARGLRVMRVTWRQLSDSPEALLVRLTRALALGTTAGGSASGR